MSENKIFIIVAGCVVAIIFLGFSSCVAVTEYAQFMGDCS
jgi:hypothetical protein